VSPSLLLPPPPSIPALSDTHSLSLQGLKNATNLHTLDLSSIRYTKEPYVLIKEPYFLKTKELYLTDNARHEICINKHSQICTFLSSGIQKSPIS